MAKMIRMNTEQHQAQDDPVWPYLRLALAVFSTAAVDVIRKDDPEAMRFINDYGDDVAKAQARFNRRVRKNCGDMNVNFIRKSLERRKQNV